MNDEALREPGLLARVIAATDLIYLFDSQWGRLAWFPPPYVRRPADAPDREMWGHLNRRLRDYDAHLLRVPGEPWRALAVETFQGSWRTFDGANHGDNLLTLWMWRWGCRYGQAGARIARAIGITVPQVASHA